MRGMASKCCDEQMLALSAVTTLALLPSDALVAAYGELVDRKGPRKTFLVGMGLACVGLGLISINMQLQLEPLWYLSFSLLGASGPGIFFSVIFLSEKHPHLQPIISAVASATFDGSALCFYLWNAMYFRAGIGLATIAGAWLLLSIVLAGATVVQLPSWAWLKRERSRHSNASAANADSTRSEALDSGVEGDRQPSSDTTPASSAPSCGEREDLTSRMHLESQVATAGSSSPERSGLDAPLIIPLSPPGTPANPLSTALRHTYYGDDSLVNADAEESLHRASRYCPPGGGGRPSHGWNATAAGREETPALKPPSSDRLTCHTAPLTSTQRSEELRPAPDRLSKGDSGGAISVNGKGSGSGNGSRLLPQVLWRADTLLLVGSMMVVNLKASYYIISFSDASRIIFDEKTAQLLDVLFNIGFPVGALIMSPLASLILRHFRKRPDVYMATALFGVHLFSLCTLLPYAGPQMLGATLFGPTRTMMWSCYFHFLSQPRRYPRALAGRTLGYANLLIAIASDVPPPLLKRWVVRDDWMVHWAIQALLTGCLAFPYYLWRERQQGHYER